MNRTTCDNCNRRCEAEYNEELDGVFCPRCTKGLAPQDAEVTGRRNTSHANCDHPATKAARAACRRTARLALGADSLA